MNKEIYQAARDYAQRGLAVFPVKKNKHPYTMHGVKDATTDLTVIREWWKRWPDANIGIATGTVSGGLIVIDQDIDDGTGVNGVISFQKWCREKNVKEPDSWLAITGRGGYHLYLKSAHASEFKNSVALLEGVDIRADGGYVIAPPSVHQNGRAYTWEYPPDEYQLETVPEEIERQLLAKRNSGRDGSGEPAAEYVVPAIIKNGERNEALFKLTCSLQAKGLPDKAIIAAVETVNTTNCLDPLDRDELRRTINSALKYQKGAMKEIARVAGEWREPVLKMRHTKDGTDVPVQSIENCVEAIEYDPELFGHIRYNKMAFSPYVYSNLPWEHKTGLGYREWSNIDDSNLKCYIESKYGLKQLDRIMEGLVIVAHHHPYNPIEDMLSSCYEKTDHGRGYIRGLLPKYLGVEDTDYQAEVMKLFMLGAISRALRPGCKFDYMLTLVGPQGAGKSTFLRRLAMVPEWYNDNLNTVEGDKATEKLRGKWIVELAELLAAKKAKEVESIKAFLTSQSDTYRPPYNRRTEDRPRCCVFAATTNSSHFLTDRTGNRRYLPILVRPQHAQASLFEDTDELRTDIVQAWGEAMQYWYEAEERPNLVLSKENQKIAEQIQGDYLEEDGRIGIIQEWLDNLDVQKAPRVCTSMIYREALGEIGTPPKMITNQIADIMDSEIDGWQRTEKKVRIAGYGIQRGYERVPVFKPLPKDEEIPV